MSKRSIVPSWYHIGLTGNQTEHRRAQARRARLWGQGVNWGDMVWGSGWPVGQAGTRWVRYGLDQPNQSDIGMQYVSPRFTNIW